MEKAFFVGLTTHEFWASIASLCVVGLMYLGQDVVNEESSDEGKSWRWGDAYRRPKKAPTWGNHRNCACAAALMVSMALGAIMH